MSKNIFNDNNKINKISIDLLTDFKETYIENIKKYMNKISHELMSKNEKITEYDISHYITSRNIIHEFIMSNVCAKQNKNNDNYENIIKDSMNANYTEIKIMLSSDFFCLNILNDALTKKLPIIFYLYYLEEINFDVIKNKIDILIGRCQICETINYQYS